MRDRFRLATGFAVLLAITGPAIPAPAIPAPQDDSAKVVAVVQGFLDAMARRDKAAAYATVLPEGRFSSVREEAGKTVSRSFSNREDIEKWTERTGNVLERIWNPEVRLHGRMAIVTAPYDFHRDGRFSHCGIDVFELLQTADGWRISGGVYTVETQACPPSPLGPPDVATAPKAQDAAVVNPGTIHVKFDNSRVRVLETILEPGDREQPHAHPASVVYVLAGGTTRSHAADGTTTEMTLKAGDVLYRDPLTHWAENTGTTTIHIILVEIKP